MFVTSVVFQSVNFNQEYTSYIYIYIYTNMRQMCIFMLSVDIWGTLSFYLTHLITADSGIGNEGWGQHFFPENFSITHLRNFLVKTFVVCQPATLCSWTLLSASLSISIGSVTPWPLDPLHFLKEFRLQLFWKIWPTAWEVWLMKTSNWQISG